MALQPTTDLASNTTSYQGGATNNAGAPLLIVAAGTGDNTAVTGQTIDTLADAKRGDSILFAISAHAALGASETLTIAAEYQESDDGITWDTAVSLQSATTLLEDSGSGSNLYGVVDFGVNLRERKQYIRCNFTPDLSASSTDEASVHCVAVMGGAKVLPA